MMQASVAGIQYLAMLSWWEGWCYSLSSVSQSDTSQLLVCVTLPCDAA